MSKPLKAPFPWFGGKSRVSAEVWKRFGEIDNYVEPFFGSGAVLLGRPEVTGTELINDLDGMVANFWRAVKQFPNEVAEHAQHPVFENDLHAKHYWLVNQKESLQSKLEGSPDFCDPKIAGWWCWGIAVWIGGGWCSGKGPWSVSQGKQVPQELTRSSSKTNEAGIIRQRPNVEKKGIRSGVSASEWIESLANRIKNVDVLCGDWQRACTKVPTTRRGETAVFLDPPYADTANRANGLYATDSLSVAHDVRRWAIENGEQMKIALCGYVGEHEIPNDWSEFSWKAIAGYSTKNSAGVENASKERIWFSPRCVNSCEVAK